MLFNSFDYIIFLPLVLALYFIIPNSFRWAFLLAASYYFYACWRVEYLGLIILSSLIDYWAGIKMSGTEDKRLRKRYMLVSLLMNLSLLFFFKYFNFVNYNLGVLASHLNIFYGSRPYDILLPVGISFYTFQSLSYILDVYRGNMKAERHLGYFLLYVSYFPQLVAGPIERADKLIPQLHQKPNVNYEDFRYGINKLLLGFFKKVVVADNISVYVDQMYANVEQPTGIQFYVVAILFSIQIFADFSGYSDIAVGSARFMGVHLMENFNRPLWSSSIAKFWSRWHISLTSWLKDYLFAPLVKNRVNGGIAGFIVLVLIGFWHGAKWTFIFYGTFFATIMTFQHFYKKIKFLTPFNKSKIGHFLLCLWNFNLLILGGILFRSQNMGDALVVYRKIFTDFHLNFHELFSLYEIALWTAIFVSILLSGTLLFNRRLEFKYNRLYVFVMLFLIVFFGQDLKNQFIYFQF